MKVISPIVIRLSPREVTRQAMVSQGMDPAMRSRTLGRRAVEVNRKKEAVRGYVKHKNRIAD